MKKKTKRNLIILIYGFIGGFDACRLILNFDGWHLILVILWITGLYFILNLKKWM